MGMNNLAVAIIYVAFFALIGMVCYWTKSGLALWGLLFMPSITFKEKSQ